MQQVRNHSLTPEYSASFRTGDAQGAMRSAYTNSEDFLAAVEPAMLSSERWGAAPSADGKHCTGLSMLMWLDHGLPLSSNDLSLMSLGIAPPPAFAPGRSSVNASSVMEALAAGDSMPMDEYTATAYDAVWAAAIGAAAAFRNQDRTLPSTAFSGSIVMEEIRRGRVPAFGGASGPVAYKANGDLDLSNRAVAFTNFATDPATGRRQHRTVGYLKLQNMTVELRSDGAVIGWANGQSYPYVRIPSPPWNKLCVPTAPAHRRLSADDEGLG